jgi:hypothetical protein
MAKEYTKSGGAKLTINSCRECPALNCKNTPSGLRRFCTKQNDVVGKNINTIDASCPLPNKS